MKCFLGKFRIVRLGCLLVVIGASVGLAGCRGRQAGQDAGTSTGLPYRPSGNPTVVEVPPGYPIYPTPLPASSSR